MFVKKFNVICPVPINYSISPYYPLLLKLVLIQGFSGQTQLVLFWDDASLSNACLIELINIALT